MYVNAGQQPRLLRSQLSASALVRVMLDPVIIIGTLAAVAMLNGESFDGPYLVLALIVFSLTFPASPPQAAKQKFSTPTWCWSPSVAGPAQAVLALKNSA